MAKMMMQALALFLLASVASAECDTAKYSEAATACGTTATKCATDAAADVQAACSCSDNMFSCTGKAISDTGCDTYKEANDAAQKSFDDTKEAVGCSASGAVSAMGSSWVSLFAVAAAAMAFVQ